MAGENVLHARDLTEDRSSVAVWDKAEVNAIHAAIVRPTPEESHKIHSQQHRREHMEGHEGAQRLLYTLRNKMVK